MDQNFTNNQIYFLIKFKDKNWSDYLITLLKRATTGLSFQNWVQII